MTLETTWKKERKIWHKHFGPGLLAGILVGVVATFFELSGSNVAMFASIGASAVILTNKYKHHLTMLRTILGSYVIGAFVGVVLLAFPIAPPIRIAIAVVAITMALYSLNIFHPPAISAGLAIVLYDRPWYELVLLVMATIGVFIVIRLIIYLFHEHLEVREFWKEFVYEKA